MDSHNDTTIAKSLNLRSLIPPAPPPRPYTRDFSHITVILEGFRNPIFKFVGGSEVRVGRHVGAKIRWNNLDLSIYDTDKRSISRRHCRIYFENEVYLIEDLNSCNGTWLNGLRLPPEKPTPVKNRDYVQIGPIGLWVYLPKYQH